MPPPEPPYASSIETPEPAELGELLVDLLVVELGVAVGEPLALLLGAELALAEVADRRAEVALLVREVAGDAAVCSCSSRSSGR